MLSERSPILYDLIPMWNLDRNKQTNKIIEKETRFVFVRGGFGGSRTGCRQSEGTHSQRSDKQELGGNVPRDDCRSHRHMVPWKVVKTVFTKGSYHKEKTNSFSFTASNRC